jgi:hypothetical protein
VACDCQTVYAVANSNEVTGRDRAKVLYQAASAAGWYRVGGRWRCGGCYGSDVLDAVMRKRSGHPGAMLAVDAAADDRRALLLVEVRR